tara:strand:+ start:960 stop:2129 length:1170 start_codon:yes stop_codon:yes gene_type:complete
MKKQKVCIIGSGLTGLVTAITLSKLNLDVDLITSDNLKSLKKSNRTTAISQNNFVFLKKKIGNNFLLNYLWPCTNMKLYTQSESKKFHEIFKLDKKESKKVMYMVKNFLLEELFIKYIKKSKTIKLKTKIKISEILNTGFLKSVRFKKKDSSKYNLIIVCTGGFSDLEKKIFKNDFLSRKYNEFSITAILKHAQKKNNSSRQIFLNNEIFALLPISKSTTSIVWSVKKNNYKNKSNLFLKNKIIFYAKNFYKKIKFSSDIEFSDLNFFIRKKYFNDRILLFGDSLHKVHPLAGQGFNMILRDLASLESILRKKINLGLDIGSSDILSEFSEEMKPRNFIYSLGIDFLRNCFSIENQSFQEVRNQVIKILNKNNLAKDVFYKLADVGLKF